MKLKLTFCTVFILTLFVSGTAQSREIRVGSFSELAFGIPGKLYLTQGNDEKVEIECSDRDFDEIEFRERGDALIIENRDRNWGWRGMRGSDITVYVTMRDISKIAVSGSGDLEGENVFKTGDLRLSVSGSGNLSVEAQGDDMDLRVSGSGNLEVAGEADFVDASISGSGKIRGEDLVARTLDASISGSGSIYISAEEEIAARISGSGNIYYRGNPDKVRSSSSGSGKVRRMR